MEAMAKVLLHTSDRPLGFHLPFLFPNLEPIYYFPAAWGIEDTFGFCHAGFEVNPFELDSHVSKLVMIALW